MYLSCHLGVAAHELLVKVKAYSYDYDVGERAFYFCGPAEWNCVSSDLQMIIGTTSLKK